MNKAGVKTYVNMFGGEGAFIIPKASKLDTFLDGNRVNADNLNAIVDRVNKLSEVAMPANPIKKCDYCGTWGVDKMSCPKCGAPINYE